MYVCASLVCVPVTRLDRTRSQAQLVGPLPAAGIETEAVGKSVADPDTVPDGLASSTGHPAISVPAGFADGAPVGLEFCGRAFAERARLQIAYASDQPTAHRRQPNGFSEQSSSSSRRHTEPRMTLPLRSVRQPVCDRMTGVLEGLLNP